MSGFVKKWVSVFLAGIMTAMLFGSLCVSAEAQTAVTMADGGSLWYYWDFAKDGLEASVGGLNFHNLDGTRDSITPGNGHAKLTFDGNGGTQAVLVYATSKAFQAATDDGSRTDRYLVMETDFISSDKITSATFEARKTGSGDNVVFYKNSDGNYKDKHYVVVFDMQEKKASIFEKQAIGNSDTIPSGDYGKALPKYTGNFEKIAETSGANLNKYAGAHNLRFSYGGNTGSTIEFDNFGISTYKELYQIINSAADDQTCRNALASFDNMQIIKLPYEYRRLPADKKLEIAKSLREHDDFTTDDDVLAYIQTLLPSQTTAATVYYDWDFEDKGLVDSVRNEVFLKDNVNAKDGITYAADPANRENHAAKVDFSKNNGERLVFTNDTLLADADKYQIAVYDMKIYLESGENLTFSVGSGNNRKNLLWQYAPNPKKWVPVKAVIDKTAGTAMIYTHDGQKWIENGHLNSLTDFSFFDRFSFLQTSAIFYVDDFKVSVYNRLEKPLLWVDGMIDTKYKAGSLRMSVPVDAAEGAVDVMLIAAQYDTETDVLIQCAVGKKTISGSGSVEVTMDAERQEGTEIRLFLWRTEDMMPLQTPIRYEPYQEGKM